jgi:chloramphenicol 3-O-phosphotransferase
MNTNESPDDAADALAAELVAARKELTDARRSEKALREALQGVVANLESIDARSTRYGIDLAVEDSLKQAKRSLAGEL